MSLNVTPRVRVPKTAAKGEIIEIKTLISHPMESGQRKDPDGNLVPRRIVNRFEATFNGQPVFQADWHPAITANPFMAFYARVEESGEFAFAWTDDDGSVYETRASITVS